MTTELLGTSRRLLTASRQEGHVVRCRWVNDRVALVERVREPSPDRSDPGERILCLLDTRTGAQRPLRALLERIGSPTHIMISPDETLIVASTTDRDGAGIGVCATMPGGQVLKRWPVHCSPYAADLEMVWLPGGGRVRRPVGEPPGRQGDAASGPDAAAPGRV
jgi:hypothetical protein